MIETVLILAFSLALFVYWFRYTVLLLLSEDRATQREVAITPLSLAETRATLSQAEGSPALDRLHGALEKDYRMLSYLLDHAAGMRLRPLERSLLILDYRMLRVWYRITRSASTAHARRALEEMTHILSYIARKMDQRAAAPSRA